MNPSQTRVVFAGLGPIGLSTLKMMVDRSWVQIVGAVDIADDLQGRDVGDLAGIGDIGVEVSRSIELIGAPGFADVVVLCTASSARVVQPMVTDILKWGASVVTTCEELSYPWFHHHEIAHSIDQAARSAGRTVLGAGVNPGFAMDAVALYMSGACEKVDSVIIRRVVDAASRRGPLQRKIGAGISTDEFEARREGGAIGHVGLVESAAMVGHAFGWKPDAIHETLEPVLATEPIRTDFSNVGAGSVAGIRQIARVLVGGCEKVLLHLDMYVGAPDPRDTIELTGTPNVTTVIEGLHGDVATSAMVTNAAGALAALPAGLSTMLDAAPVRWYPLHNAAVQRGS